MATNGTALDLSVLAEAGGPVLALLQVAVIVIPLLTLAVLVPSQLRHHGHRRTPSPLWLSRTTAGTRYALGETSLAEYRRATAANGRLGSALR